MLNIVNTNKVIGKTFVDGRFVCTYVQDSITQWRFQFEDLQSDSKRFLWIELHKSILNPFDHSLGLNQQSHI